MCNLTGWENEIFTRALFQLHPCLLRMCLWLCLQKISSLPTTLCNVLAMAVASCHIIKGLRCDICQVVFLAYELINQEVICGWRKCRKDVDLMHFIEVMWNLLQYRLDAQQGLRQFSFSVFMLNHCIYEVTFSSCQITRIRRNRTPCLEKVVSEQWMQKSLN